MITNPKHIAITGASGGLGRAITLQYASPNTTLSLCGRNTKNLALTANLAREKKAHVITEEFDIRDKLKLELFLKNADALKPLDLLFCNAGICRGVTSDGIEIDDNLIETMNTNGLATLLTASLGARLMIPRGQGQVVLISSQVCNFNPMYTPAYNAAKSAVKDYGFSLRHILRDKGIGITVVTPGFLLTPMAKSFKGAVISPWHPERAAKYICAKLKKNPRLISFPFSLKLLDMFYSILPECACKHKLLKKYSFRVEDNS
ncbi:MAG: SDR family NAD(P)-dependent oxidoreductase [Deltaproteobacteria bacterium]|jgi:short-subunit dehydrogenase|nr:SDR family NAD(P)-dependent oxidoreductase [Deltaproteobacteria bacterium]